MVKKKQKYGLGGWLGFFLVTNIMGLVESVILVALSLSGLRELFTRYPLMIISYILASILWFITLNVTVSIINVDKDIMKLLPNYFSLTLWESGLSMVIGLFYSMNSGVFLFFIFKICDVAIWSNYFSKAQRVKDYFGELYNE